MSWVGSALLMLRRAWVVPAALALAWLVSLAPLARQFSDTIDDAVLRAAAQPAQFDDLVLIDFDDASLRELQPRMGPWPYARHVHAALLAFLREAQAHTVVFDIVFGEPRKGDEVFAEVLAQRPDVVLAAAAMRDRVEHSPRATVSLERIAIPLQASPLLTAWPSLTLPTPGLLTPTARPGSVGIVTTPLDADGRLRRLPLLHQMEGRILPSLALAPLLIERDAGPLQVGQQTLRLGAHTWATDEHAAVRVALPSNASNLTVLPANRVLAAVLGESEAAAVRGALQGRTVFVGSSAFLGDQVVTAQGQMAGAAVLTHMFGSLQRNDLVQAAPWPLTGVFWAVGLLPCLLVAGRGRPAVWRDGAVVALAVVLIATAALVVFRAWRLQVSPLMPLTIVAIGYLLTLLQQMRWADLANRRLRRASQAAEAANAAKSEFLAGVSHELRTPLHAVLGMADALANTPLSTEQTHYVEVFRNAGSNLASLIDDLLDLSRIEAARLNLDLQPLRMQDLLQAQMALFEPRAASKGLQLQWQVHDGVGPAVVGDSRQLAQVLTNLVGNAIKFTRQGGVAVFMNRRDDGLVHVQVRDTGIGIAGDQLERIFEPFAQADSQVSRYYGGTGLGLAIARRLVDLMGGRLWAESALGVGSVFHFTAQLPLADTEAAALPGMAAGAPQPAAAIPEASPPARVHLLLVEDNDVNVMVIEAMLKGSPHTLDIATNGESAIQMCRDCDYGLVLMDVHMPGMDGYTATRAIRQIEAEAARRPMAIVALTAGAFDADRTASLAAGCNAHLTKPLARQQLLDAVARYGKPA